MLERILWVVAVLAVGGVAFFGGQQIGQQAGMQSRAAAQQQFFNERGGPGGGAQAGPGGGAPAGPGGGAQAGPGGQSVMGTVTRVDDESLVLTTADGAELTVTLTEGGTVRRQVEGELSDLTAGEQVVAFGTRDGTSLEASSIQIGGNFGRGNGRLPPSP